MTTDDLEARLTALFDRQARAVPDRRRDPADIALEIGGAADGPRRSKRALTARALTASIMAAAAVALAVVAVGSLRRVDPSGPASAVTPASAPEASPLDVSTGMVTLSASDFAIEVGGKRFVGTGPADAHGVPSTRPARNMDVHTDPGWAEYMTLELTWIEHDVEMRLYIYFFADGQEWGSKEIRIYDGAARGEWIRFHGDFFRSPLGAPFVGDVDLTATDHGVTGRLVLRDLQLEAFRETPPTG